MQFFIFSEIFIIVLMAFCELFRMEFSEFKNSIYIKRYAKKQQKNVEISLSAKIATIFAVFKISVYKFNTTILSSTTITPEDLSPIPSFLSEI